MNYSLKYKSKSSQTDTIATDYAEFDAMPLVARIR